MTVIRKPTKSTRRPNQMVYSYDYNYKFSGLLEEQLLTGGLRLAKVLDEILQ